jgi:LysM repeat protein
MKTSKLIRASLLAAAFAAGAISLQAALNLPVTTVNGVKYYYYEVQPKESLYSLTHKLGVTRAEIVRCNPSVVDGLKAKQRLYFPYDEFSGETTAETTTTVSREDVTLQSKPVVPEKVNLTTGQESVPAALLTPAVKIEPVVETTPTAAAEADDADELNIAVMLPFMLQKESITRQADNYTEFYRGMLMAVDTLAASVDFPIKLYAYDTEGSEARVKELMQRPEMQEMTYIIAPDDSACVEQIALVADSLPNASVVSLFSVHNNAFLRHESVIQANIPSDRMYSRAIDAFISKYGDYTPVILNATDAKADKQQFTRELNDRLISRGIPYVQVDFEGTFNPKADNMSFYTPDKPCVFIPTSASREVLTKIASGLQQLKTEADAESNVKLFGYPDWIILTGSLADKLYAIDTTIYSRFALDKNSIAAQSLLDRYKEIYGRSVNNAAPTYGVLGFDTGRWLINAMNSGLDTDFAGLQNNFSIAYTDSENSTGSFNDSLLLVRFDTTHQLVVTPVK